MAYIDTDTVKQIRTHLKSAFPRKDGWKFSVRKEHYSSLHVTILESPLKFTEDEAEHRTVNEYYLERYSNTEVLKEIVAIMNGKYFEKGKQNFNHSDAMTDYFHVGWYVNLHLGDWNKPLKYTGE